MSNYTLTYSEEVKGFPSFYSYYPDWMIGMNNYFYTFYQGNLYRHNVNEVRNNFYGTQYTSTLKSVLNDAPLENKLFKTLAFEGDNNWESYLITDIQDSGFIDRDWLEKKEQTWYGFVRNLGTTPAAPSEYALRSLDGIGRSSAVAIGVGIAQIDFPLTMEIGNIISVGDMLYFSTGTTTISPLWAGQVTQVNINIRAGINNVIINTTAVGTTPIVGQTSYFLFIKNSIAESQGVLGHYCVFDIENNSTTKVELFSVESEVMKSFP
jgi:environmental stress-induced protein Ves